MDVLIDNMTQQEEMLYKVNEELVATESRLNAASAKETLASLAEAKNKLIEQKLRLSRTYEETTQHLVQIIKKAHLLVNKLETKEGEEEKAQILTSGPDVSKNPLDKTIGDYIEEGLTRKLDELSEQDTVINVPLIRKALPILTKDLDGNINMKAL